MSDRTYRVERQEHNDENCACLIVTEAGETIAHYSMPLTGLIGLLDTASEVAARVRSRRLRNTGEEGIGREEVQRARVRDCLTAALDQLADGDDVNVRQLCEKALWHAAVWEYHRNSRASVAR